MPVAVSSSIGCNSPLDKALDRVAATGAKYVDILTIDGWVHVNPSDLAFDFDTAAARLDAALVRTGLTPLALNTGVGPQLHHRDDASNAKRLAETKALLRLMKKYNLKIAAIQPRAKDAKRPWPEVLADCVASLREQYALAAAAGVQLALELHVHSPFETVEEARDLFAAMPEIKLVYDPTHFVMQGIPLKDTTWIMDRAIHVHSRDAAKGKIQTPLDQGEIDFTWMLKALKDRGYAGSFSIEYLESKDFDVIDSAKRLHDLIASHTR